VSKPRPPVCDYEGSDYQQRFWDRGERSYEDRVEAVALRRLLPAGGDRLLEVGAGAGRNTTRYVGFRQVVLLDYSRTQLEQAQTRLGAGDRYLYVAGDAYRLPFAAGVFETATMIRTLHHMADPLAALRQVRGTLRPGGVFILEYANKQNLKAIARWLLRRQAWNPFDREPIEFARLNFDFHPAAVRDWLRDAGFEVSRQLTVSHFRLPLLKRLVPTEILVGLDALAQWTGNGWQLTPSVFARAEAVGEGELAPPGAFWQCPACTSLDLESTETGLHCAGCGRLWPVRDGIHIFKEEEIEP
jgi:SAM-dependent methyltransferase